MRIDQVKLSDLDPMRLLAHGAYFEDEEKEEGEDEKEKKKRQKKEEYEKIGILFNSMTNNKSVSSKKPLLDLFRSDVSLKEIVTLLNRSDVQNILKNRLNKEKDPDPIKREQSLNIKKNLEKLNARVEKENRVWRRKAPLFFRIFWQIEKIKIPKKEK